jgi:hypothetical protein
MEAPLACFALNRKDAMMKRGKNAAMLLALGVLIASLTACEKKEVATEEKGPAEKAGKQIDQAAAKAGEELNKVAEKAGEKMQQAGQKLQNEAAEAQKKQ